MLACMILAKEMGVCKLTAKSDSQLITDQVSGTYLAKDPQLAKYLRYVQYLANAFESFELMHVPREQNTRADFLSKLATSAKGESRSVIQETLRTTKVSIGTENEEIVNVLVLEGRKDDSWMMSYVHYLAEGELPQYPRETKVVKKNSKWYLMIDGYLFRDGFSHPLLKCISSKEANNVMNELYESTTRSHIRGRTLSL